MIKRILILICLAVLVIGMVSCSCEKEEAGEHDGHNHSTTTTTGTSQDGSDGSKEPPLVEKHKNHYWTNVEILENETATSSSLLKGYCYECGEALSKEVITIVSPDEWRAALSTEGLATFTAFSNGTYTDYNEKGSKSWRVSGGIQTEEYCVGVEGETSREYAERFAGFALGYNSFSYSQQTRSYVSVIDENTSVELGFANGKLLFHRTNHKDGEDVKTTQVLFLNYDSAMADVPDYFFEQYEKIIDKEALEKSSIGLTGAEKVSEFLASLSFDGAYEVSFLANGQLSVYFYLEEEQTDPIFNSLYKSVSVVAVNGKITSLTIGNNTLEITY